MFPDILRPQVKVLLRLNRCQKCGIYHYLPPDRPTSQTHFIATPDYIQLVNSTGKQVKTIDHQQVYKQLSECLSLFAPDTLKSNFVSTHGNKYFQLFCNRGNLATSTAIQRKSLSLEILDKMNNIIRVMMEMRTNDAKELYLGNWGDTCSKFKIQKRLTEPYPP